MRVGFQVVCVWVLLSVFDAQGAQSASQEISKHEMSKHDEGKDAQGLALLFHDGAALDVANPQLVRFLETCPYNVCKLYKAFIAFEASPKAQSDIAKAVEAIQTYANQGDTAPSLPFEGQETPDAQDTTRSFLGEMIRGDAFNDIPSSLSEYMGIPAWVALHYPEIFDGPWDRTSLTDFLARTALEEFDTFMNQMERGRWATTSYCTWQGSIRIDLGIHQRVSFYEMHLAPARVLAAARTYDENLEALRMWSFKGLWNARTYERFQKAFDEAVQDLQAYYKSQYPLAKYASHAQKIVSWYVGDRFPHKCFTGDERVAYEIVTTCKGDIPALKDKTQSLNKKGWDALLHMAILADYPLETLAWMIERGAGVNTFFYDETCLMKAVARSDVLGLLLRKGADPNAATLYGKTALFYAVQFGNLEAVQVLLEARARPDAAILDLGALGTLYNEQLLQSESEYDALPEMVADFTPLVYALRYGTPAVQEVLMKHGATLGKAPRERIQKWVLAGERMRADALTHFLEQVALP